MCPFAHVTMWACRQPRVWCLYSQPVKDEIGDRPLNFHQIDVLR